MLLLQGSRTFATELPKTPTTRATKVLQVWKAGTLSEGLRIASGKLQRSTCQRSGQQVLPSSLTGPDEITLVACVNNRLATISVKDLVSPCILGVDFLHAQKLMLDFGQCPVRVCRQGSVPQRSVQSVPDSACTAAVNLNNKQGMDYDGGHVLQGEKDQEECAVPCFRNTDKIDFSTCPDGSFVDLLQSFKDLFKSTPGKTTLTHHLIPTTGSPLKVPPRRVPAEYRAEVEGLLKEMLQEGIIEESSSPWMAPAVYVKKKTGEIRLCVDYRALNKQTTKDAYPLPLPDKVQDRLCGCTIFSTLDLRSGYWQVPIAPSDVEKTAFCPGPGLGLFHFKRMPFGLTGAPRSFQRLMDKVLRGLNFVTTYLDDVLVHSKSKDEHIKHLNVVFSRLKNAGLTLRGSKCHIGHDKVYYLGHVFSEQGMRPDEGKVRVVKEWPTPKNPSEVRQFLGLASYYRRYIQSFATIAASLHELTQKDVSFRWTSECDHAFNLLKEKLTQAPILVYPQFGSEATPFILETDASDVGIAAVLQQDGHVIAYASRALSKSEKNYSVIQKECLAIVYGTKQFRHYLLGRSFTVLTDHAPLQWLSAQKMEGLLCRWALALQEYDFVVQYRKGSQNSNADALSRLPSCTVSATTAVVGVWKDRAALRLAQEQVAFSVRATPKLPYRARNKSSEPALLKRDQKMSQQVRVLGFVLTANSSIRGNGFPSTALQGDYQVKGPSLQDVLPFYRTWSPVFCIGVDPGLGSQSLVTLSVVVGVVVMSTGCPWTSSYHMIRWCCLFAPSVWTEHLNIALVTAISIKVGSWCVMSPNVFEEGA
eukprot:Em0001g2618a